MDRKRIHIDLVFGANDLSRARNIRDSIKAEYTEEYDKSSMPDFKVKPQYKTVDKGSKFEITYKEDECPCATCGHSTWKECMDNRIGDQTLGEPLLKPDTVDPTSNCRCCNFPKADGVCKH
jgi:hypothetical protein